MTKRMLLLCAAIAIASPALADDAKIDGKALYSKKCAMCHGADGVAKATAKGSANFNDPAYTASVDEIVKVTLEGKGKMKKVAVKPEQAKAIAEHVKTMVPKK